MSLLEQLEKEVAASVATPHSAAYEAPVYDEAMHGRIERTLAEAEAALEEARLHGDLALDAPLRRKADRRVNTRLKVSV